MADESIGFDVAGGIGESPWAQISTQLGAPVPVAGSYGAVIVRAGSGSMTVEVPAGGISYAFGHRWVNPTTISKTIAPVTLSGAVRWDAIVIRRDWSTNSITIEVVQGTAAVGAAMVVPTLNNDPGAKVDQLLALVKATNGSTALDIRDRRVWSLKPLTVPTSAALPAPTTLLYGVEAYVLDERKTYRCLYNSGPAWVADAANATVLTGTSVISTATNWTLTQSSGSSVLLPCRGMYDQNGQVQIDLQVRRSASTINTYSSAGGIPVSVVGTLPSTLSPDADVIPMPFAGQYTTSGGSDNSWRNASFTVDAVGVVRLHQVSSEDLAPITSGVSIRAHLTFTKRT